MIFREKVEALVNQGIAEKPAIFLIDLTISDNQKIMVTLDGDQGVSLQDCIDISKVIDKDNAQQVNEKFADDLLDMIDDTIKTS